MKHIAIAFQLILFCTALALSQAPVQNEGRFSVAGLDDDREVQQFFISFKEAIAKGDKKKIASLVKYPIRVNLVSGRWRKIENAAEFMRTYERIFDERFKQIIVNTEVTDLWAKWSGVAMPSGEIWFNGVIKNAKQPKKYTIKITAINGFIRS